ncbi:MAG: biopolymer transporter ExbD [Bacteroidales bacterium]|nr:biopolymer transporter ExbD [Bacteroidales bacterium]
MAKRELQEINAGSMADIAFLLLIFFLVTTTMDKDAGLMRLLPPPPTDVADPPKFKERDIFIVLINSNNKLLVEKDYMPVYQLGKGDSRRLVEADKDTDGNVIYYFASSGRMLDKNDIANLIPNEDLYEKAKEFILNPYDDVHLPLFEVITKSICDEEIGIAQGKINALGTPTTQETVNALQAATNDKKRWEKKKEAIKVLETYGNKTSFREAKKLIISLQNAKGTSYGVYIAIQNELSRAYKDVRDEYSRMVFGKSYEELDGELEKDKIDAIQTIIPIKISEAEPKSVE